MAKAANTTTSVPPALTDGYKANFDTLLQAGVDRNLAMISCIRKVDNVPVAMVVAIHREGEDFQITPLAVMCEGNPYEDYRMAEGAMPTPRYVEKKKAVKKKANHTKW
jgi:Family of unknown function (DUF6117)